MSSESWFGELQCLWYILVGYLVGQTITVSSNWDFIVMSSWSGSFWPFIDAASSTAFYLDIHCVPGCFAVYKRLDWDVIKVIYETAVLETGSCYIVTKISIYLIRYIHPCEWLAPASWDGFSNQHRCMSSMSIGQDVIYMWIHISYRSL